MKWLTNTINKPVNSSLRRDWLHIRWFIISKHPLVLKGGSM